MLLLQRPPYLRWLAAALLLVAAFAWDLHTRATQPFPFAAADIERGATIDDTDVSWKDAPAGLWQQPLLVDAVAAVDIGTGDPITASSVAAIPPLPSGWWTVAMDVPPGARVGGMVRLVMDNGAVTGLVIDTGHDDGFGIRTAGLVAVPGDAADLVGQAVADNAIVLLFEP